MKRAGYIFNGWYWDSACTKPVTGEFTVSGDMTFYAGWISQYGYTVSNNKAKISYIRYWDKDENGNNITHMYIPEKIGGYPVYDVDFKLDARAITGITFPNSMTNVREWSFSWYTNLKDVILSDGITVIEEGAFARSSKIENVVFGKNLKTIGDEVFTSCSKLTKLDLPDGLISIGSYAFSSCGIEELVIPDSVTTIGECAFGYCPNLRKVNIGKGVTNVSGETFEDCEMLESINVSADNPNYSSVDGVLYSKDKTVLYKYPPTKTLKTFKVPETVTKIADYAFYGCILLENIDISNVKTIGISAFNGCENLKNVDLSAINELGDQAFYGCKNLKTVTMPERLEEIKYGTFYGCTALESIVFPENLKIIGSDSFSDCSSLKKAIIPESVTDIQDYAFYGCSNLTEVKLPSQITYISMYLFGMCENLEEIEIPKGVESIGGGAFYNCIKLKKIDIPDKVTYIEPTLFQNCKSIEKIIIPEGVTGISYMAFYGCESLRKVILPASVTSIEFDNFGETLENTEIYFMGTKEQWDLVEISEYGNEYLENTTVYCADKVIAEIGSVAVSDTKISGKIFYDVILEDTDILVGLYIDDVFVDMFVTSADKNSTYTDFEFTCDTDKNYEIRTFFWNTDDMYPKGNEVSFDVK